MFRDQVFILPSVPHAQHACGFTAETCSGGAYSHLLGGSTNL